MTATELVQDQPNSGQVAEQPTGWRFQPPRLGDPRLKVASVVISVQVLGQVSLGFDLSIAQILVSLLTAAAVELALTAPRTRVIAWPGSALLTGNGIALILRVPGTEHGDWWSLRGWYVFAATAALGVLAKHALRDGDRPWFNPSNLALVVTFLVLGSGLADPQDLWWGPMSLGLIATYVVVITGGLVILRPLGLLRISLTFWAVFAALMAVVALSGHSMTARWSLGPVAGMDYWTTLVLSPEVVIFVFFMITDPRTVARGRTAALLYAVAVAATSSVLIAWQTTEYATKVALLAGLVLVCGVRPLLERWAPAATSPVDDPAQWVRASSTRPRLLAISGLAVLGLVAGGATSASVEPTVPTVAATVDLSQVELAEDQVPEVEVAAALAELGGSFDEELAQRLVRDTVAGVLLADRAVADQDAELARAVAAGPYLERLLERPAVAAPERTFDTAVVDVVRNPEDFQAQPRLSIDLSGTVDGVAWSADHHVLATTSDVRIEKVILRD